MFHEDLQLFFRQNRRTAAISSYHGGWMPSSRKKGSSRTLGGRAAGGRVCGRAKLLAGTLRCLHLCWRLPWNWSDAEQLGRCPKPHKGQTRRDEVPPLDPARGRRKGTKSPLAPSARLSWSRFHAPSACSFFGASPKPLFAPATFREEPKKIPADVS